jgi:hypothetical protein
MELLGAPIMAAVGGLKVALKVECPQADGTLHAGVLGRELNFNKDGDDSLVASFCPLFSFLPILRVCAWEVAQP